MLQKSKSRDDYQNRNIYSSEGNLTHYQASISPPHVWTPVFFHVSFLGSCHTILPPRRYLLLYMDALGIQCGPTLLFCQCKLTEVSPTSFPRGNMLCPGQDGDLHVSVLGSLRFCDPFTKTKRGEQICGMIRIRSTWGQLGESWKV